MQQNAYRNMQLLSILTNFSCILQGIGLIIYNDSSKFMRASGLFFISSGLILNITGLTFFIDNAYKSMNGMTISLKKQLLYERDCFERQKINNIIGDIEQM